MTFQFNFSYNYSEVKGLCKGLFFVNTY